jgi:cellulose synthase/poly-beta-1,6-N-acetylglucosamine synthase-like glycosyltransferase
MKYENWLQTLGRFALNGLVMIGWLLLIPATIASVIYMWRRKKKVCLFLIILSLISALCGDTFFIPLFLLSMLIFLATTRHINLFDFPTLLRLSKAKSGTEKRLFRLNNYRRSTEKEETISEQVERFTHIRQLPTDSEKQRQNELDARLSTPYEE